MRWSAVPLVLAISLCGAAAAGREVPGAEREERAAPAPRPRTIPRSPPRDRTVWDWDPGLWPLFVVGGGVVLLRLLWPAAARRPAPASRRPPARDETLDVTVLRIALDARVRPFVERVLAEPDRSLGDIARALRGVRDAWVAVGAVNTARAPADDAEVAFRHHVAAARTRVVRAPDGEDAPVHEGADVALVTLVVAARQELFTVARVADGDELRRALEVLSAVPPATVFGVELVWTPTASAAAIDATFRGELAPIRGAMAHAVVCDRCSGPFPRALAACPRCGEVGSS